MKVLYFDMEFANGQVPGSIYSLGYLFTDEEFRERTEPVDILINPEAPWNEYVAEHILAYPKEEVEAAPAFPERYTEICRLIGEADLVVGFSIGNDITALRRACRRYELDMPSFPWLDTERLARLMEEHTDAHGLDGYVKAWCGLEPGNRHRSDGDAYATMLLLEALCRFKHVDAAQMHLAYPEAAGIATPEEKKPPKKPAHPKRRPRRPRSRKKEATTE